MLNQLHPTHTHTICPHEAEYWNMPSSFSSAECSITLTAHPRKPVSPTYRDPWTNEPVQRLIYASVTLPKKWAEPGPRPNLNFGKVKNSRLGRGFSPH